MKKKPQIALDYIFSRFDSITLAASPSKIYIWLKTNKPFSFFLVWLKEIFLRLFIFRNIACEDSRLRDD